MIYNSPGLAQGVLDTRCFHSTTFLYLFYKEIYLLSGGPRGSRQMWPELLVPLFA